MVTAAQYSDGSYLQHKCLLIKDLDFASLTQVFNHPIKQINSAITVLVFAPSQSNLESNRIAFLKPLQRSVNTDAVVGFSHVRTQLDFFQRRLSRTLLLLLLLLIPELTKI
ncbi:hypothetical protein C1752_03707 [Acaryochloris thomasi RCC1774]|uniref:Uncharacterized protein n=1 Tax=Acaryochloris thomasi RCC1774 TaxID=1764569 RepID=A0A2W1JVL7_9CYAN|nr:hypothetical protein C1752_03707 [Acaryochloris thomasi RCC1774]